MSPELGKLDAISYLIWVSFMIHWQTLNANTISEPPCCRHCKQNGLPCTSNLPISETRFKKRASSVNASSQPPSSRPSPPQSVVMPPSVGLNQQPSGLHLATTSRATARNPSIATTATPSREPPPPPPSFPLRLPPVWVSDC